MWFNNALIYQYQLDESSNLFDCLSENVLKPCPPHARFVYGWVPVFSDELIQEISGANLICLGKEERLLPKSVIHKMLEEKIKTIEAQQGRMVKRAEKAQLTEDIEFELLPKSFCIQKKMFAIFDTVSNRIIINTSSINQSSQLTAMLRKSVSSISIEPLAPIENLAVRFAQWIHSPNTLPSHFQLASDCLLFSLEDEKKRVQCKGYEHPAEEIVTLLSQDMATAEISLIWKERIHFTLTQDFVFKKLKALDYFLDDVNDIKQLDEEYQQKDASLALLSGELRALINDLLAIVSVDEKEPVLES